MNKKSIALALSGGGVKGFAHLGIIKAFEEANIEIHAISGASAGAIVGAFIASGKSAEQSFSIMKEQSIWSFAKVMVPTVGFMSLERMREVLKQEISHAKMEDLPIPLHIACSNLSSGKVEYFSEGPLLEIVQASSSIPLLFAPVELKDGHQYVDGGMLDNLPIQPLVKYKEEHPIVAINLNPILSGARVENLIEIAARIFQLSIRIDQDDIDEYVDVLIAPDKLIDYDILDASKAQEIFDIGYEAGKKVIDDGVMV